VNTLLSILIIGAYVGLLLTVSVCSSIAYRRFIAAYRDVHNIDKRQLPLPYEIGTDVLVSMQLGTRRRMFNAFSEPQTDPVLNRLQRRAGLLGTAVIVIVFLFLPTMLAVHYLWGN
jgi:hypothetical protein